MAFSKILLPRFATLDHAVVLEMVQQAMGKQMKVQFAHKNINLPLEHLASQGVLAIGVGRGRSYREREIGGRKFLSEAAVVLNALRSAGQCAANEALDNLVVRVGEDNDRGTLTNLPYALNWILRQSWRLENNPEVWMQRTAEAVRTYLEAACSNGKMDLVMRKRFWNIRPMRLVPEKKRNHQGPMLVVRYMRDLFALGESEDAIFSRVEPFLSMHDWAKEKGRKAEQQAETDTFETFLIPGHDFLGTWIESDDPYLTSALARRRHLIAVRNSMGNVILMSKTFDLTRVGKVLAAQEPGRWYLDLLSRNIVPNGTERDPEVPTGLSRKALEYIIGDNVSLIRR